jgi:hypothetical protein
MPVCLLRLLLIAALSFRFFTSYGQDAATSQALGHLPEPLFIINSTIIANGLVAQLDAKNFKHIVVYKEQTATTPTLLKNLATGIIAITYDGKVESKSFAKIGRQYGVQGPLSVVLNGRKLSPEQVATLRIAPEAIGQVQVTRATPGTSETIVAIQLAESKPDSQGHAPGTIMIR